MCCVTNLSKYFVITGVRGTILVLGTIIMVEDFELVGMLADVREVEGLCKDPSKLVGTGFEYFASYSIRSSGLICINGFEHSSHLMFL